MEAAVASCRGNGENGIPIKFRRGKISEMSFETLQPILALREILYKNRLFKREKEERYYEDKPCSD